MVLIHILFGKTHEISIHLLTVYCLDLILTFFILSLKVSFIQQIQGRFFSKKERYLSILIEMVLMFHIGHIFLLRPINIHQEFLQYHILLKFLIFRIGNVQTKVFLREILQEHIQETKCQY